MTPSEFPPHPPNPPIQLELALWINMPALTGIISGTQYTCAHAGLSNMLGSGETAGLSKVFAGGKRATYRMLSGSMQLVPGRV